MENVYIVTTSEDRQKTETETVHAWQYGDGRRCSYCAGGAVATIHRKKDYKRGAPGARQRGSIINPICIDHLVKKVMAEDKDGSPVIYYRKLAQERLIQEFHAEFDDIYNGVRNDQIAGALEALPEGLRVKVEEITERGADPDVQRRESEIEEMERALEAKRAELAALYQQ